MLKTFQYATLFVLFLLINFISCTTSNALVQTSTNTETEQIKPEQEIIDIAKKIHSQAIILDAHADIATPTTSANFLSSDGLSKVAISKLKKGGLSAVVMSIAVPPGPRTMKGDIQARIEANRQLTIISNRIDSMETSFLLINSVSDISRAKEIGKVAIILGFQNARSLQKDVTVIDSFYNEGVRLFGLNHLGHNEFSDSSRPFFDSKTGTYEPDAEHGGLSPLGIEAIKRINLLGGIIDVSQMSKAATLQALQLSTAPIIASHSNVRSISNVSRNLSDEEIDLFGKKGGVIHVSPFRAYLLDYSNPSLIEEIKTARRAAGLSEIYSYPFELYWEIKDPTKQYAFLKSISDIIGPADVDHLIDHIDYIVNRIGIDHVGIGTDFNHGSGIDGFMDAADALNVTIGLVRRGYSEKDIKKIWGGNFIRVFQEAERQAKK